tara:strand:- start:75 stop:488 length:414 start_codon:yes stop_codon:yes gene_type:complete
MKTKNALDIIYRSLVSYIEDSAGANTEEAKEIQKAYFVILNELQTPTFSYRCSVTGEGFNGGYLILDENKFIKYEKDLVAWLRGRNVDEDNELSDEFLVNESHEIGEYVELASIEVDENDCYDEEGNHCTTFKTKTL